MYFQTWWAFHSLYSWFLLLRESVDIRHAFGTQESKWDFDNYGSSMLVAWITTTGDHWNDYLMQLHIRSSASTFANLAWPYFTSMALVLNLVIANLFAAVVVHAFLVEKIRVTNHAGLEEKIRLKKTLFNRMDADRNGEVDVAELYSVARRLDLDIDFADFEVEDAMNELDVNGDGMVECVVSANLYHRFAIWLALPLNGACSFEEFAHWWDSNSNFVIKLKKAIRKQEEMIRSVWVCSPPIRNNSLWFATALIIWVIDGSR